VPHQNDATDLARSNAINRNRTMQYPSQHTDLGIDTDSKLIDICPFDEEFDSTASRPLGRNTINTRSLSPGKVMNVCVPLTARVMKARKNTPQT
jgi:hypothetical protein